jgi:hypothetical protein
MTLGKAARDGTTSEFLGGPARGFRLSPLEK